IIFFQFKVGDDLLDSSIFLCPNYGPPSGYPCLTEVARGRPQPIHDFYLALEKFPLEVRVVESPLFPLHHIDRYVCWIRIKHELGASLKDTDGFFVALFLSDFDIVRVALELYQKENIIVLASSLHHSVWVHRTKMDPRGWYLAVIECQVVTHGRARLTSHIFDEHKDCVLTVVQEAYF
ncbi:hypothetical protein PMAYCL1PPCAC_16660, partial [Pristionchus mayeri]